MDRPRNDALHLGGMAPVTKAAVATLIASFEVIERMAVAMWQDESHRCSGRDRKIPWEDEGETVRQNWRRSALAAFMVILE